MAFYMYKARNARGSVVTGEISAESEAHAFELIDGLSLFPVEIAEKTPNGTAGGLAGFKPGRIRSGDVTTFTRQLADLLKAGVTINRALSTLASQAPNKDFSAVISDLGAEVSGGSAFSDALAKYPRAFPDLFVKMVRAGETGGFLEEALHRLADFRERQREIRARIQAAMAYPALLAVLAAAALVFLMVYFVPTFSRMFDDLGGALPLSTRAVIGASGFISRYFVFIAAGLVAASFFFARAMGTRAGRLAFDKFLLRLPVLGPLFTRSAVARFSRILGTLLRSGVPILNSLDATRDAVGNAAFAEEIRRCVSGVREGMTLAETLKSGGIFPEAAVAMIAVGEEAGNLEEVLIAVAEANDNDVDRSVRTLVSLAEPLMLVVMAAVVGVIVVSMILPIFSIQGLMS